MKKSILLSTIIGLSLLANTTTAYAANTAEEFTAINDMPVDIYSKIVEDCSTQSSYGGAYFLDGVLHITASDLAAMTDFVNGKEAASEWATDRAGNYVIDEVTYSYDELYKAKAVIRENKKEYGITGLYTNPMNNSVVVEAPFDISDRINELVELTGVEQIESDIVEDTPMVDDVVYMRGGSGITFSNYGCSLGGGIKFSDGSYGYISTGHNVSSGVTYKYNGTAIGTASTVVNSGSMDVTLITRTNTSYLPSQLMNNGVTSCSSNGAPIVNDSITMFGNSSGSSSGTILAIDYDVDEYTNLIKADYERNNGDSGGAVVANRSNGNVFVGIHKGTRGGYTVATNWKIVKDTYGLNRWSVSES